jgi:predicted DNA-binding transcriptional regulator AlpA
MRTARTRHPEAPTDNSELLRSEHAAAYLGVMPGTLNQWRYQRKGPRYLRPGGGKFVLYRKSDLDAWLNAGAVDPAVQ